MVHCLCKPGQIDQWKKILPTNPPITYGKCDTAEQWDYDNLLNKLFWIRESYGENKT